MVAFQALQSHPAFHDFTLDDISRYARLIGHLKHDILLPQPLDQSDVDMAPKILPPSIVYFLHKALGEVAREIASYARGRDTGQRSLKELRKREREEDTCAVRKSPPWMIDIDDRRALMAVFPFLVEGC